MIGALLLVMGTAGSYIAARQSILRGLLVTLTVGYFYGIIRANSPGIVTYFLFDFSVLALYVGLLQRGFSRPEWDRARPLLPWLGIFFFWTFLILILQLQNPLVQLVGLRGHLFFLPFMLIGAMMLPHQFYGLALWLGFLNIVCFCFAVAEFFIGVDRFYPYQEGVTTIIYKSTDLADFAFRIPGTFGNAHLFGGTMVITLPFLVGAWVQSKRAWHSQLLLVAIAASSLSVFMAAARINMLLLFGLIMVAVVSSVLSRRIKVTTSAIAILMAGGVAWVVSTDVRLQRFMMLLDFERVATRLGGSVNRDLISAIWRYPLGNGLGGGGTNMPPFLQGLIQNLVVMENEYARIALELGVPGLLLWLAMLGWIFTRPTIHRKEAWFMGRRLAWCACIAAFGSGILGMGILMAVPQAAILLLSLGWVAVRQPWPVRRPPPPGPTVEMPDSQQPQLTANV